MAALVINPNAALNVSNRYFVELATDDLPPGPCRLSRPLSLLQIARPACHSMPHDSQGDCGCRFRRQFASSCLPMIRLFPRQMRPFLRFVYHLYGIWFHVGRTPPGMRTDRGACLSDSVKGEMRHGQQETPVGQGGEGPDRTGDVRSDGRHRRALQAARHIPVDGAAARRAADGNGYGLVSTSRPPRGGKRPWGGGDCAYAGDGTTNDADASSACCQSGTGGSRIMPPGRTIHALSSACRAGAPAPPYCRNAAVAAAARTSSAAAARSPAPGRSFLPAAAPARPDQSSGSSPPCHARSGM